MPRDTSKERSVCAATFSLLGQCGTEVRKKNQCEFLHFSLALHPAVGTVQADHLLISCLGDYYQRTEKMVCMENKPGRD